MLLRLVLLFTLLTPTLLLTAQTEAPPSSAGRSSSGAEIHAVPRDGIVDRQHFETGWVLPYEQLDERDILWSRRVWRVIDIKEKINQPMTTPGHSLFDAIIESLEDETMTAYTTDDDKFTYPMTPEEVTQQLYSIDTVFVINPTTYVETMKIVESNINPNDITRYRIKEVWYFNSRTSSLDVRILGIAPLRSHYDNMGNFKYEAPMFWLYYPHARQALAHHKVYNRGNDTPMMSYTDLFDMRQFGSYISKASNVHDRRLEDYLSGVDLLLESKRLENEILNYEHDLWEP